MLKIKGKKVAIIGLGKRTGVETARVLSEYGAKVTVSDVKGPDQLTEELKLLQDYDIEFDLNGHGQESLDSDFIVVSPGVPLDIPFFRQARKRGIPVISEIELAYNLTEAKMIAITGTNGKTTTTKLLGNILKAADLPEVRVAGNIGIPLIKEVQGLVAENWVVVEVSSFQLETIRDFKPEISLYLNFTADHLDRHKTVNNYWQAKKRIFENQTESDIAIINTDDQEVVRAVQGCRADVYGVSLEKELLKGIYLKEDQLIRRYSEGKEVNLLSIQDIPLRGNHNVQNVAFTALTADLLGVDKKTIREQIEKFTPISHRLEEIDIGIPDITFVDDSKATNPDAAIKAIASCKRPVVLIAGGQDRDADFSQLAKMIDERVKDLILLGETRNKIAKSVLKIGFNNIHKVETMEEAVSTAAKLVNNGDCLLLSPGCPSWDMYSSYKERGKDFRDNLDRVFSNSR